MADDITVKILQEIRDAVGGTNARLDQTNARLERVETRLEGVETRLDRMDVRLERVELGLRDLGGFMKQIVLDQAKHERFHTHHVDLLEKDVSDLKVRVERLEAARGG